jgi:hypothetical protein
VVAILARGLFLGSNASAALSGGGEVMDLVVLWEAAECLHRHSLKAFYAVVKVELFAVDCHDLIERDNTT